MNDFETFKHNQFLPCSFPNFENLGYEMGHFTVKALLLICEQPLRLIFNNLAATLPVCLLAK